MTATVAKIFPAIVGHPDRGAAAHQLFKDLRIMKVMDFCPYVSMDHDGIGCDDNHLRAWTHLVGHGEQPWLMVLEDDAVLADDFAWQIESALNVAPAPIVSLYLGRTRPDFMQPRIAHVLTGCSHPGVDDPVNLDVPWVISNRLLHCVAVAIRRDVARPMVPMLPVLIEKTHAIDQAITEYARMHSIPVAYTVPSLVDHADGPSYAQHADRNPVNGPRVAWVAGKRADWTSEFKIM